jgi:hypothetical protein
LPLGLGAVSTSQARGMRRLSEGVRMQSRVTTSEDGRPCAWWALLRSAVAGLAWCASSAVLPACASDSCERRVSLRGRLPGWGKGLQ